VNAGTSGQAAQEFTAWAQAQGIGRGDLYGWATMADAFAAGRHTAAIAARQPQPAPGSAWNEDGQLLIAAGGDEAAENMPADIPVMPEPKPAPGDFERAFALVATERNQLRWALGRLADNGNLEARERLAKITPANEAGPQPAPELAAANDTAPAEVARVMHRMAIMDGADEETAWSQAAKAAIDTHEAYAKRQPQPAPELAERLQAVTARWVDQAAAHGRDADRLENGYQSGYLLGKAVIYDALAAEVRALTGEVK
jgi:hypothetical protein